MIKNNISMLLVLLFFAFGVFAENNFESQSASPKIRRSVVADFDGDGKTDLSVNRGYEGDWHIRRSSDNAYYVAHFGRRGDLFIPGDFDGDGKADLTVLRRFESGGPVAITWFTLNSSDSTISQRYFGLPDDTPVVGDYDGDGKTDLGVFRTSFESYDTWYISRSSDGAAYQVKFGHRADRPIPADYDGDGKTDIAVYRTSEGNFYILKSSDFSVMINHWSTARGREVVIGDYDGDGRADPSVFINDSQNSSRGIWTILNSSGGISEARFIMPQGSYPIRGDYDGDGKDDIGYYHNSTGKWHIKYSSDNIVREEHFGMQGDLPISVYWFTS